MDEWISVVDGNRAVCISGDEVAGIGGERRRREKGEGGDCGGVVERADLRGEREVVDFDCVVIATRDSGGAGDGDGFDGGEVGGEGEERL